MADFEIAYPKTSGNEGYYVSQDFWRSHGNNSSGETYMGVDRIQNPNWAGWDIIDQYKATNGTPPYNFRFPVELGLEDLVKDEAKQKYWDAIKGDQIQNQDIAQMVFEQVWGGYGGIARIQEVINGISNQPPIDVDGVVGRDTLTMLNTLPQDQLYQAIWDDRKNWIETVGAKFEPSAVTGWLNRLDTFRKSLVEDVSQQITNASEQYTYETLKFGKNYVNLGIAVIALTVTVVGTGLIVYFIKTRQKNAV